MANRQATKNRIKAIRSIRKTTNAMRLVSSTKLRQMRRTYERTREFAQTIEQMLAKIMNQSQFESSWMHPQGGKEVLIVLISDMGLCGGYNSNLVKMVKDTTPKDTELLVIGKKQRSLLVEAGYSMNQEIVLSDALTYQQLSKLMETLLNGYKNGEISKITLAYTKFVNSLTFTPTLHQLLPVQSIEQADDQYAFTEYEPNEAAIMDRLIPQYLKSVVYNFFYESKTSEQSARRIAMEQATDNADELIELLQLQYNQARQAAITQELTEIVASSES